MTMSFTHEKIIVNGLVFFAFSFVWKITHTALTAIILTITMKLWKPSVTAHMFSGMDKDILFGFV